MSASRVMSGSPAVRADAQMSASNGSRVNRSSSATKTSSGVMSIGWYAGLLNGSLKNSGTVRRKFPRATRASMLHSHMTTVGTYRIASRRSHRSKNAVARGPSFPPPAAWNTSACVSVTAARGSATSLFCARSPHSVLRRRLAYHERLANRLVEHRADDLVGMGEQRVARVDVDGADDRPRRPGVPRLPHGGDELIQQLTHAPGAGGTGAAPVAARVALGVVEQTRFLSEKQDFRRLLYRGHGGREEQTL